MQVNHRGGKTTIVVNQAEARRCRDASYLATLCANNLPEGDELKKALVIAANALMIFQDRYTSAENKAKLDAQDAQQPG